MAVLYGDIEPSCTAVFYGDLEPRCMAVFYGDLEPRCMAVFYGDLEPRYICNAVVVCGVRIQCKLHITAARCDYYSAHASVYVWVEVNIVR